MDTKSSKTQILLFLFITFILTYGVEIFLIMPMAGSMYVEQAYLAQILVAGVMFIPAIGALLTRLVTKEKFSKDNLMLSLNLKGNLKYYVLVWFGFALLIILGAVLYFAIFPKQFDGDMGYAQALFEAQVQNTGIEMSLEQIKQVMLVQIITGIFLSPFVNFVTCFGEEWGWRGFLLPKMLKCLPKIPALLLSGVIWGLWHAPLTIMGHNYGLGYRGFPFVGILAMCVFCVVLGTILSYVTIKTGSCVPAIIGHGTINGLASASVYFTSLQNPYNVFLGPMPTGLIGGAGFIALAAVILCQLNKEEKIRDI